MPLADHAGGKALFLKGFSQRDFSEWQARLAGRAARSGIEFETKPLLIAAGHDARPRWGADRTTDVTIGAADATVGEGVDVGRLEIGTAVNAQVAKAEIVRHDDNDVRFTERLGAQVNAETGTEYVRQNVNMDAGVHWREVTTREACWVGSKREA